MTTPLSSTRLETIAEVREASNSNAETARKLAISESSVRRSLKELRRRQQAELEYFGIANGIEQALAKTLIFESVSPEIFTSFANSFLLLTIAKHRHVTQTAYEIFQRYISKSENGSLTELLNIDFLVITLSNDPYNSHYGNILQFLVETRLRKGHFTWINSRHSLSSSKFQNVYGTDFADFLQSTPFEKVKIRLAA